MGEKFDVLDSRGERTGEVKDRSAVHSDGAAAGRLVAALRMSDLLVSGVHRCTEPQRARFAHLHDKCVLTVRAPGELPRRKCSAQCVGDWHRAVHVWLFAMDTQRLLLQKRSQIKDSWPGRWDISAAGHGALQQVCGSTAGSCTHKNMSGQCHMWHYVMLPEKQL